MKHRTLGFLAAALASSFWGCGFFFGKIALEEMNVGAMVLYRFAFASLGLLPFVLAHRPRFSAAEWRTLLLASFIGVPLQFLLQFKGLSMTTVSHASLMVGTLPVLLAVGATIFAHERMNALGWMSLALSTCGAALIALGAEHHTTNGPTLAGDLLVVVSLFIALCWILINKSLMQRHGSHLRHRLRHLRRNADAGRLRALRLRRAAGAWHLAESLGSARRQRPALHRDNHAALELGPDPSASLAGRRPAQHGAAHRHLLGIFVLSEHLGGLAWLGGAMILTAAITLTTRSTAPLEDPAMV